MLVHVTHGLERNANIAMKRIHTYVDVISPHTPDVRTQTFCVSPPVTDACISLFVCSFFVKLWWDFEVPVDFLQRRALLTGHPSTGRDDVVGPTHTHTQDAQRDRELVPVARQISACLTISLPHVWPCRFPVASAGWHGGRWNGTQPATCPTAVTQHNTMSLLVFLSCACE